MGSILKGVCKNCGYQTKDLYYGGGFMNSETCCKFPVLNKVEKEIKMENIMDKEEVIKQNPNLVFYDDESLSDKKFQTGDNYHQWGEFKVFREGYFCPKCKQFTVGFVGIGCWD